MTTPSQQLLTQANSLLGLDLTAQQIEQLVVYATALEKWNQTYNLTAIRDIDGIVKRHLIDALSIIKTIRQLNPKTLADIGTGAGIPGIIIAITCPKISIFLVESIGKKCRFLRFAVQQLGIQQQVEVVQQRVEAWHPEMPISLIVCRAFTSLANFTTITGHLGDQQSTWLAMKSAHTKEEETQLSEGFNLDANIHLDVPFEQAERHLLILKKQLNT